MAKLRLTSATIDIAILDMYETLTLCILLTNINMLAALWYGKDTPDQFHITSLAP